MNDEEPLVKEYLDLPGDPEVAFAVLQDRKYKALEAIWEENRAGGWHHERRYVDTLIAFDEVHGLGLLSAYRHLPSNDNDFPDFFHEFCRNAEIISQKILMEAARRLKEGAQDIIVLDATARQAIHTLIDAIREKMNGLTLPERKRESLFAKLNAFAAEVDRNRTRPEAFYAFAVETARTAKEVNDELKPVQQTIDRILDWIEKAEKWRDALPSWGERKKIESPPKRLPGPRPELDDEIPF